MLISYAIKEPGLSFSLQLGYNFTLFSTRILIYLSSVASTIDKYYRQINKISNSKDYRQARTNFEGINFDLIANPM